METAKPWKLTDLHVVGGLTKKLNLDYYIELFGTAKKTLPSTAIQAMTAVEIQWLADLEGLSVEDVLIRLRDAGLDAIPGGGAEIFSPRIRKSICPNKITAEQWLSVHRTAHPVLTNSIYAGKASVKRSSIAANKTGRNVGDVLKRAEAGNRLSAEQAVLLHDEAPFYELGRVAHSLRSHKVGGDMCTFIIDRNISFTNVCVTGCKFCAFHKRPGREGSFVMPVEEIVRRVKEAADLGATQIMLQGGLNPDLDLRWYERMLAAIKSEVGDIWLHSLSPAEIFWLARRYSLTVRPTLERLRSAGLDSLPGGGAEILVDQVRQRVSPAKITATQWFEVMETAQNIGMSTTATMVYGMGETTKQRIEHLMRIRELQDRTYGFRAFIPWSFQSNNTQLSNPPLSGVDYLRMVAISRLVLDNVNHIQAGWVTEGPYMAQLALTFGAPFCYIFAKWETYQRF